MIETFYGLDTLHTPKAFLVALLVGLFFGFALERAGFGSSRKLIGVFYLRDMAVFKVMFTALITAMLGLSYCMAFGWVTPDQIYMMPTIYGAQVVGGLIFGVGFVMGGWCPGTAAAGIASGKVDALVFLVGTLVGSTIFSEVFPVMKGLYDAGNRGVVMIYDSLGMSRPAFIFLFSVVIVAAFWGCELVERMRTGSCQCFNTPFMRAFSVGLLVLAGGLFLAPAIGSGDAVPFKTHGAADAGAPLASAEEKDLMSLVESAQDHIEPEELADRLMRQDGSITLVDVRPGEEFDRFHIRGAVNIPLPELAAALAPHKNAGLIILYSNGMTHPAQARDSLSRLGLGNVYLLTDGLQGFKDRVLKPVSLCSEPLSPASIQRVNAWRAYFAGIGRAATVAATPLTLASDGDGTLPGVVQTDWLASNLGRKDIKVIDCRSEQPAYNQGHVPGSLYMSVESFRGHLKGVPAMLLPGDMITRHLSFLGIQPSDTVVLVADNKVHNATLVAMALVRVGHAKSAVLDGGFGKWAAEKRPVDQVLPSVTETIYGSVRSTDDFTVDYMQVLDHLKKRDAVIIDVRPADFYSGKKSDEARAGHIPGALNRPYTEDLVKAEKYMMFKPVAELAEAYAKLIPAKDSLVIVHCRTGHQASQAFFVLKRVLGYRNVLWYDAGWTEWSARAELPVETGPAAQ